MVFPGFFFDTAAAHSATVHGMHHPGLVTLSICVSIFAATMALLTAQIARRSQRALHQQAAILTGALALGGGIWATHFIGMLAFQLPARVNYSIALTLLSLLPAFIASWFALRVLAMQHVTRRHILTSGTWVGVGIGTMHYSGMAAIQTPLVMRYDAGLFALSILVAIGLAVLALWVGYGLRRGSKQSLRRLAASGAVLGLAIASMHYTGMAAVRFIGQPVESDHTLALGTVALALILAAFSVMLTVLVLAVNGLLRVRDLYLRVREGSVRLQSILDTAVDGIITIDAKGLIQDFNHSAERLFGWTAQEVVGRNIKMLMPEPYQSAHDGYLQNYRASGQAKIIGIGREVVGLRKDGSHMPMRLAVGRVDLPGELLFVGFVSDISDRHALEASLRETAEQAQQAAAAKSTFLANMSHEIRTPMNSIIGFTELLLQTDLKPTQREHLLTVRQASKSLLRLINDILDTTKMEKGKFELEFTDFSLRALAMQVESSLRLSAVAKRLELTVNYPEDMPDYFKGDPLRVLQILNNLVGNAIKFTETGGVELVFAYEPGMVHIQVRDTGIGMSADQIQLIFAPFAQADVSISRRFGGTGLGTTIALQLAEQMGGGIDVESSLGYGSTFNVRLPLPLGDEPENNPSGKLLRKPVGPLRVLIADDVPQNLEVLALILEREGFEVTMANDGAEALQRFTDARFDVVLMDVHMPGLDGLQASKLIREFEQQHGYSRTPIVALTASVMAEDRRAACQAGMDGFAVKPLDVPQLLNEIARVLEAPAAVADGTPLAAGRAPAMSAIDWERGLALWGEKPRLLESLNRFLSSIEDKYPLPRQGGIPMDDESVLFSLHGIRGAAGNFALPALASLAGSLEGMLREGKHPELQQYAQMRDLIAQARQAVAREERALRSAKPSATPPSDEHTDAIQPLIKELRAVLQKSELNDELLEAVCEALVKRGAHAEVHTLRETLESFEFAEADTQLGRLLELNTWSKA